MHAINKFYQYAHGPARLGALLLAGTLALNLPAADKNPAPPPQYQKDAEVVQQAQEQALEQLQALKEKAADARAKAMVEAVEKEMQKALEHLSAASNSPTALSPASAAEQAAYQALLKLSAHEYQVSKRNRSQGGQQNSQQERNQRQVDELDLKQSENKYETQSQASPQQSPEQKEQLQVLSRLKELAQRQQDLNQRLKELQAALQEAKTDQEREEIRRRLKRLREQEQEMLADLDELRQRMDRSENQSRMADARQKLDQTRSEVQRAAEALDNQQVPQALSSGTRAQRDLQQLSDDFRKKTSSQFTDQMRQMRNDARQLAQKQEELAKQLDALADAKRKTLNDSDERKELAAQWARQKSGVTNLFNEMRGVSEQSETAEPLLSKQLYDTLRQSNQEELNKSLDFSSELAQRGFLSQAGQFEQRARRNIDEIKRGVEKAAESVLGNDVDALRLAKRELETLSQQLEKEIAQNDTNAAPAGTLASADASSPQRHGPDAPENSARPSAPAAGDEPNPTSHRGAPRSLAEQGERALNSQSQNGESASGQETAQNGSQQNDQAASE